VRPADASVLLSIRGVPSWGAVLIAVAFAVAGIAVDGALTGALGWGFKVLFLIGVVVAVLAVRRGSIFTAMVQPPLLLAVAVLLGSRTLNGQGLIFNAFDVVKAFPTMAVCTGVVLLLGLVRIIAQPIRRGRSAPQSRPHAAARA
jgi:hypothetical protein